MKIKLNKKIIKKCVYLLCTKDYGNDINTFIYGELFPLILKQIKRITLNDFVYDATLEQLQMDDEDFDEDFDEDDDENIISSFGEDCKYNLEFIEKLIKN